LLSLVISRSHLAILQSSPVILLHGHERLRLSDSSVSCQGLEDAWRGAVLCKQISILSESAGSRAVSHGLESDLVLLALVGISLND
jgi:hypothetical protein